VTYVEAGTDQTGNTESSGLKFSGAGASNIRYTLSSLLSPQQQSDIRQLHTLGS
jgi:hypothetical protein